MSRSVEQIKDELSTVNLRFNILIDDIKNMDSRCKAMSERRYKLMEELEQAEDIRRKGTK